MNKLIDEIIKKEYSNIAGIYVLKDGKSVYESYFNECDSNSKLHVYSVTKSIVSILIGIAIDKGYIKSIDQKVLEFFPDYTIKRREKTIKNVTIRNLLTMTAPYKYKSTPYTKYFTSEDSVKFTLDLLGGKDQTGEFRYTPMVGPDILSGILVKVTGQSVIEFARENLFSHLGITVDGNISFNSKEELLEFYKANNISAWAINNAEVNTGGWGLTLTPNDMTKIGQLYLNDGKWNGNQIASENWIKESTKIHSFGEKLNQAYGFLWWIINDKERSYAAMGDGGNIIYINTKKKLVVSIASFLTPRARNRIVFIEKYIEPLLEN